MKAAVNLVIECEQELDGRWLAEATSLPGVLAYATTLVGAILRAELLADRDITGHLVCKDLSLPLI